MDVPLISALVFVGRLVVGGSLLAGGIRKLIDLEGARIAILDYRIAPPVLARPLALLVTIAEVTIGTFTATGIPTAAAIALLLIALFSIASAQALARGLEINCHCACEDDRLSINTLARNAFFMVVLATGLVAVPGARHMGSLIEAPLPYVLSVAVTAATVCAVWATARLMTVGRAIRRTT
ncbi:MAG: hypothetical protein HYX53_11545 [Chloroflexi bacterium]|nr:hypothetical protein [Chloroflexota bacterium]